MTRSRYRTSTSSNAKESDDKSNATNKTKVESPYFSKRNAERTKVETKENTGFSTRKRKSSEQEIKIPIIIRSSETKKDDLLSIVDSILSEYTNGSKDEAKKSNDYITKGLWSLTSGLVHIITAEPKFLPLIKKHGPPTYYLSNEMNPNCMTSQSKDSDSFETKIQESFKPLCRIIIGQQLGGAAASSIWNRFLDKVSNYHDDIYKDESSSSCNHTKNNVNNVKEDDLESKAKKINPSIILKMIGNGDDWDLVESQLRKPVGLSKAKVRSIIDLAKFYERGDLSDDLLLYNQGPSSNMSSNTESSIEQIKSRLLKVKGIGPWTCDMFLMFHSHSSNILPMGDLGIRKGSTIFFGVKGKGKNGTLCEKKDHELLKSLHEPFQPYRSLSSFYMWKCADTTDFNQNEKN